MLDKVFDPAQIEQRQYHSWEQSGVFACAPTGNKAPFTIMMPPPNVTGSLHLGHALVTTLQDVLIRYHRKKGDDALWMPGTDHAGIATQLIVERQLAAQGQSRHDFTRPEFIDKIWEWKAKSGGTITTQLRRLGASPDWARERFTMDEGMSRAVRKAFVQLYKEGLIYRDKRLVNWDPKMHTALSDLEVATKESKGHMWYIRYPIEGQTEQFITIATTRPETMLGDTALVVHPNDERYKDLIGKFAILPLVGRLIPILADDYIDPEYGTGAMKVTPAHDFNDFELGKRHNLAVINILDRDAKINDNAPEEYQGLDRFEARKKILAELEQQDLLVKTEDITHAVPYDEKSKSTILEPWLTDQWFVDAKTLAIPAIEAVETGKTQFVPKFWENTYFDWLKNIQPWCISRQIWWGHQIPAWYGPDGTLFVEETEEDAQTAADAHYGEQVALTRDSDVLDTWFSSALWPFSTLGWPDKTPELAKYYPGDVLVTGFDIIFFWVARMMMMGLHFMGEVPFKTVYMHGLVRDINGQKMSKTKGNVIDPLEIIDQYGADALRFALTVFSGQGRDIRLSPERVESFRNFATKLWNATRYCQMNECRPDPHFDPAAVTQTLNRWIVDAVDTAARDVGTALDSFRFSDAATQIYQFIWGTFCDWYLEFTKPLLSGQGTDPAVLAETRATTAWVLDRILHILNPFMPFLTEELYAGMADRSPGDRLITAHWPEKTEPAGASAARAEIDWLIRVVSEIRSVRADMNVPAGAKIILQVREGSQETKTRLQTHREILTRMARLETVEDIGTAPASKGAIQIVVGEATLCLPIAEIIDLDKERDRLKKEIDRLGKEIQKVDQKLGNAEFMAKAPDEIVEEQKERRAQAESEREKLARALTQLGTAA